jgi:hypothetical protein
MTSAELLADAFGRVRRVVHQAVDGLTADQLASRVDRSWGPPVTLGVRLASVIADELQHAGQAVVVRGILQRR